MPIIKIYFDDSNLRKLERCHVCLTYRLFNSAACGNGFVEIHEECDCGLKEYCDNPCCNATTCKLYNNASCATGECCDLQVDLILTTVVETFLFNIIF